MACNSCKNKINYKNAEQVFHKVVNTYTPKVCTLTESDIANIKKNLQCVKQNIKMKDYNKYAGFIESMIVLKDYCRFDLTPLTKMFEAYGCREGVI